MADELVPIGELSRRTGLPVKTIRYWSDEGLVPPADRTPAGHRLYGAESQVRLGLVRTLRELGIDLPAVRRVLQREVAVPDVAAAHAEALEVRIRSLRLHQAVLRAVADHRTATPEEIALMNRLAQLSRTERHDLIHEFIDNTFGDLDLGPDFLPMMRAAMPELPDDPSQEQVRAWVELAELVQDGDFRATVRRAATAQARAVAEVGQPDVQDHEAMVVLLRDRVAAAEATGVQPGSAAARPVVDELVAAYARHTGQQDSPEFRTWLLDLLEASHDRRYERYWQLLAVINGWPLTEAVTPAAEWFVSALRQC